MPDDNKSGSSAQPAEIWTWWISVLALLVFLDLFALTWYFQALPEARFKNWEKILSTGATWLTAVIAYLGIKYKFGDVSSFADVLRIRPVQLCVVGLTLVTWYFVLPFHIVTVSILEAGSGRPLAGITVKVDPETAARPVLSDAQGRISIRGLLATSHDLRFQGDGYRDEVATASFMDVLTFGQIAVALKPKEFRVEFKTVPDGAEVYLDGDEKNRKGLTPLSLVLSTERSKVMFKKSRYQPTTWEEIAWEQIPESKGTKEIRRELVLKSVRMFPLAVRSDPGGADIFVDGKRVGTTPDTIMLAGGLRRVELKKDGYSAICNVRMPDPDSPNPVCFQRLVGAGAKSKP